MDYTFTINQYDRNGVIIDRGIFVDIGDITTIKFKDSEELKEFCLRILSSLPEIRSFENH